ncbi:MAG: hypothetical protein CL832_02120 [Crocinitomicaceae bacterium]|nr:hypothetical protein [Crocinitomicaceae bacterium]
MSPSEIEQNVNKIKELLKSDDFDVVNTGLELVRSLDEEAVYENLLEGCGADKEGKLVNEKKEISDYLVCSLASISNGQKAKEILDNVITLDFSGDNMTELPAVPEFFKNIKEVILHECYYLEDLEGLVNFPNITRLDLGCCFENEGHLFSSLEVLKKLKKLKKLDLSRCEYHHDLSPILFLDNLNELILEGPIGKFNFPDEGIVYYSGELPNFSGIATQHKQRFIGSTSSSLAPESRLINLKKLDLSTNTSLEIIDGLANLTNLVELHLEGCYCLENIDGLANLTNLTKLTLNWCESITNVASLANLSNLNYLNLEGCYNINVIPDGYTMKEEDNESVELDGEELKSYQRKITDQLLDGCGVNKEGELVNEKQEISNYKVCFLASRSNLKIAKKIKLDLTKLDLSSSFFGSSSHMKLTNIDALKYFQKIESLQLGYCRLLTNIDVLLNLKNLKSLSLHNCHSLLNLNGISTLYHLDYLDLAKCRSLRNLDALQNLKNLFKNNDETLYLTDCGSLENLNGISSLSHIKGIDLWNCTSLINVDGLANLTNLNYLNLEGCYNINVIPDGYTMKEEDNESVELDGEELKSYLQKIRDHISSK